MEKNVIGILAAGILVLALFCAGCTGTTDPQASAGANGTKAVYIVGIDSDYKPYSYLDPSGEPQGLDVDSARWIADKMGFEVKIQATAWDGMIPGLQAGKIDMVYSGMTITDERKEKVNFSIPYLKINQSVAVHKDSGVTMDDFLAGTKIVGAQRGTTGAFWVEDNLIETGKMSADKLKVYDNFPLVATDLENKRLDAIIYDKPSLLDAIAGKPLVIVGEIDTAEEYGIAIRKSDVALLNTMNEALTMLMSDPYWEELKEKHGI